MPLVSFGNEYFSPIPYHSPFLYFVGFAASINPSSCSKSIPTVCHESRVYYLFQNPLWIRLTSTTEFVLYWKICNLKPLIEKYLSYTPSLLPSPVMRVLFMGVQRDPDSPSYMHINKFSIRPVQVSLSSSWNIWWRERWQMFNLLWRDIVPLMTNSPDVLLPLSYTELFFFLKVFKGSWAAVNARFLYSPGSDTHCGYTHKGPFQEDDYLISGREYQ